jgi:hypothetical protein
MITKLVLKIPKDSRNLFVACFTRSKCKERALILFIQ